jgi:hypothetical protein
MKPRLILHALAASAFLPAAGPRTPRKSHPPCWRGISASVTRAWDHHLMAPSGPPCSRGHGSHPHFQALPER